VGKNEKVSVKIGCSTEVCDCPTSHNDPKLNNHPYLVFLL
jgi:hypothetical protein